MVFGGVYWSKEIAVGEAFICEIRLDFPVFEQVEGTKDKFVIKQE